ncbi:MAG: 50S ribosomal protein L25 [Deltaproteobacteria bacterium]|nr:50S ribosomal protein L25 [Deltaproteobacteria bacterium]
METIEIQIEPREPTNKRTARRLRREGKLPGILYGPKTTPVPFELNRKDFVGRIGGLEGSHLVRINSSSSLLSEKVALVKEMQFHPVTEDVLHVDLYEVDLTAKIQVKVPLHFVGKAEGVVRGGILQPVVREIEVECLPMDIPEFLNVDVSSLDIGYSLHIADLPTPEGVSPIYETNLTLVTVVPPTVEEAPAAAAAVPEAEVGVAEEKKEEAGES